MRKQLITILIIGLIITVGLLFILHHQYAVRLKNERILQEHINQIKITDMLDYRLTKDAEKVDVDFIKKELGGDSYYTKTYKDGTFLWVGTWGNDRYKLELTPPDSYFTLFKLCYLSGVVSYKGYQFHNGGFDKGIWYEYDEKGFLVGEYRYDNPHGFTFEQVLLFCKDNNIHVNKGWSHEEYIETIIYYGGEPCIWTITYFDESIYMHKRIRLDGNTGNILETEEYRLEI